MSILKMHFSKGKTTAISIVAFLIVTMALAMVIVPIPTARAHTPAWQIPTYAFVAAIPNPIGVGQRATVYIWLDKTYDAETLTNDYRFHNYQLTITVPDGSTNSTTFAYISDPTSNQGYTFTPTQVGTYTLFFNFPGQNINDYDHANDTYVNDAYLPSNATTTLTVQQTPTPVFPYSYPFPTEYWTRPIYGENPGWWSISSNWLGSGSPVSPTVGTGNIVAMSVGFQQSMVQGYPGDAVGPLTGHMMWTKPLQGGGVVGGNNFPNQGNTYFEGSAYNQRYAYPIIINGVLYFKEPVSFGGTAAGPEDAVDLRTGQVIWSRFDVPAISFGYVYDLEDPNQHGVFPPILFTANFARAFDAYTGDPLFNVTNVPTGFSALGPQGEHLRYVFTNTNTTANPQYYLAQWNSSRLWSYKYPPFLSPTLYNMSGPNLSSYTTIAVPPAGTNVAAYDGINYNSIPPTVVNGNIPINSTTLANMLTATATGPEPTYDWNVSVSWLNTMGAATFGSSPGANPVTVIAAFPNNILICRNGSLPAFQQQVGYSTNPYTYFGVNLDPSKGDVGSVLWSNTITPTTNITISLGGTDPTAPDGLGHLGVFVEETKETLNFNGYSMATGAKLWTTPSQTSLDWYGSTGGGIITSQVAYGNLYTMGYAGIIYCFNLTTGKLEWTYGNGGAGNSTNSFDQIPPPGHYPTFVQAVGNGILYTVTSEHTFETPIYKGALARAINATDGTEIWTVSSATAEFGSLGYAMADGYSTWLNGYDNQIYVVGRGPSTMTVEAPKASITLGGSLVISGSITDISAGTKQNQQATDFPNGVPLSSDASMKDWMGYVYQQKPLPTNFTGVPVVINVIDSNGNFRPIGSTTSGSSGAYSLQWTPDISGKYTVIANFAGTNGYWPSSAETSFAVDPAHPTIASTQAAPATVADTYLLPGIIAIIIAIVVVGAILALLVTKKRP
jgi:hypothetical protein